METIDLFLLGGSYRAVDSGVVVELYGRDRSGAAVVARYPGFRPYFMVTDPTAEVRSRLQAFGASLQALREPDDGRPY